MSVLYNEWDQFAAQWLRNLIAAGELPPPESEEGELASAELNDT